MRDESGTSRTASAQHRRRARAPRPRTDAESPVHDEVPLTRAQLRELKRRIKDAEDPTRYLLASVLAPQFALYYNVTDDNYTLNDASRATLFKRRAAAAAIKEQLGHGVRLVRCRVGPRGELIESSLPKRHARASRRATPRARSGARGKRA